MNEYGRQAVHLIVGLLIAAVIFATGAEVSLMLFTGGLLAGFAVLGLIAAGKKVPFFSGMLDAFERDVRIPGFGAICFVVSTVFCLAVFPEEYALVGVVSLAVLDSVSTMAGTAFGRHRIINGKTWEGSLAGLVATAVVLLLFISPLYVVVVAVAAAIAELISPVEDNLVIPPVVCLVLLMLPA
ncbi:MAG TPA: phosphatidate cytidylyltransferase [Methanoculleus sp.]|nr:phosphatidate cytidylyltransferase [Methanoculleus sp.]